MSYLRGEVFVEKDYMARGEPLAIKLPHSCDEWVIGNEEDADKLIQDLIEAKAELRKQQLKEV